MYIEMRYVDLASLAGLLIWLQCSMFVFRLLQKSYNIQNYSMKI